MVSRTDKKAFLGVDVGTTAIKAAIYSMDGQLHGFASAPNQVIREKAGWSEQNMEDVWQITRAVMHSALKSSSGVEIAAIAVCGQGDGLWALDRNLNPVRNAILWNDTRANSLVQRWMDDGTSEALAAINRTANWSGTAGSLLRWLVEHEPDNACAIEHVLFCKDWIGFRLTGELATDFSDATIPFFDPEKRTYSQRAFDLLGISAFASALPGPQASTSLRGGLDARIADELGLPARLPVATGTLDLGAMMTGMNQSREGDLALVLGTTAMVNVVTARLDESREIIGATLTHSHADRWIRVIAPSTGTPAYDWFVSLHPDLAGAGNAEAIAKAYETVAAPSSPGSNGVFFLPYLSGERAPFVAPNATGAFHGLTPQTTRADMARAVLEGTAFSLKHCFRAIRLARPNQVFLTGGGARNSFWCAIIANILGTTILASDESDHGLWGAALIAAAALGEIDIEAPPRRKEALRHHEPDRNTVEAYEAAYERFEAISRKSASIWDRQR